MTEKIQIALADDHPMWRDGVAITLASDPLIEVVGEASNSTEALRIAEELTPDLMLLDVSMEGGGLSAAEAILARCPEIKVIMLTVSQDDETVLAALEAGARGYVLKGVSGPELLKIVRGVHAGENYITPSLAAAILTDLRTGAVDEKPARVALSRLSKREREILRRLARGLSNRQIADEIHLSEKTIKHYMTGILRKLRVRNRVEAALLAQQAVLSRGK